MSESAALAHAQGYSGLELRSGPAATVSFEAKAEDRRGWRAQLDQHRVQALSIASYVKLCDTSVEDAEVIESGLAQARLAHDLGATWLRIFPGGTRGVPCPPDVEERAGRRLAGIVSACEGLSVRLAVETHDSHPTARDVLRLIDSEGCGDVCVIWDMLHTWLGNEAPEETVRLLAGRLAYAQVKDVAGHDELAPLALGDGVLPLQRGLDLLRDHDLTDWVSWEYERAWHPDAPSLAELGEPGRRWLTRALSERR
ncbi:sugar phosphate isomerase/epimerase family protein [Leekyejoonella antrihumi]|uniref:sugar phosphate isomerase/epimerase family protein n=1 Tax=Leekyejoonella antrihumi TaxID=1660198 RepID=UPI001FE600FA|nr:sugar phosphate isomerase/epimerase family protein [Leekyejoonella antrihumi]